MNPLYIFLLVPKTGTTSLYDVAANNYSPDEILQIKLLTDFSDGEVLNFSSSNSKIKSKIDQVKKRQYELKALFLMAPFGIHKHLDRECVYLSMLRQPVSRCLSMWRFLNERPNNPTSVLIKNENLDFQRAILHKNILTFRNEMVRMLSGSSNVVCTNDDLELARSNIAEHFGYLGYQEGYASGLREISKIANWEIGKIPHLNPTTTKTQSLASLKDIQILVNENSLDASLYNWHFG